MAVNHAYYKQLGPS